MTGDVHRCASTSAATAASTNPSRPDLPEEAPVVTASGPTVPADITETRASREDIAKYLYRANLRVAVADETFQMLWDATDQSIQEQWCVLADRVTAMVLGVATVIGCHRAAPGCCDSPWGWTPDADELGRNYHLVLDDVRDLAEPIPCRGSLGPWVPPDELVEAVRSGLTAKAGAR